jgi:hypothetical protein
MERTSPKPMVEGSAKAATGRSTRASRPRSFHSADDSEHLNARIPYDLMTQLRVYCAQNRASLQSVVSEAIETMLMPSG